ncbi:MAG: pilus assembly protein PilP [Pseudomonadales bacterium]|jgi:type IV pilus assembly protein PilO|nr:pilus assembly protein PilP [Pseudomonadales bacterium]MEC8812103.1 type 4a pilus biogenesis protein PilO [Pseudomonadota bacterium]TNC91027.1 MAG: pilus assembly protein PilP [Alcanivorax sp.]HAG93416.1 pilus assembly protein PilP [Gammaproteobacteria bacterium]MAQ24206.1 pilus assembly protein PilP [Pseudomonadales bacterium]|tara:strand:+ start:4280 stop:4873 length:594 start_codon:yes stop_codon:yes gene_type:complete
MDVKEFFESFNNLDPENIGGWPLPIKLFIWIVASVVAGFLVFHLMLSESLGQLDQVQSKEGTLMKSFEEKAFKASNLDAYKEQMKEMENTFGALLRQLPSDTEVPGLLEDISHTGLTAGLNFNSIKLAPENSREFYVELPIDIEVKGGFHAFGSFVSAVAALPRIVTLHDFDIAPSSEGTQELVMKIRAKTYRYKEN